MRPLQVYIFMMKSWFETSDGDLLLLKKGFFSIPPKGLDSLLILKKHSQRILENGSWKRIFVHILLNIHLTFL